ncbi:Peptidase_C10 and Por_Secre_tail domain-containing protein [Prevotella herbatica]|uniref:Peptidase_C10 and Por_Secre_tail domain-containing protein n=1 Tax=Prevotella herbatica TaxID=2801997 RepID=A0ABM7NY95_9BACT|nr:C10 family peptidase [Prevotella herbatica]BCS85446.1 Peptidase_C10 and Por_Secre_tail domain-containing protein [Prevotella herbatica]
MIRLLVLSIAVFASSLNTFADNRNRSEMIKIAQEKLASKSMAKGSSIIDNEVKVMKDTDQFAIYGAKGAGFVVISRSNTFPAVIGESEHDYDSTNVAPGFKWWMENISKSMAYRDANNMGRTSISVSTTIDPLITTKWNQGTPYNLLCPKVGSLTHGYTGCVATAMSQILKYYNYPKTGKGSGGFSIVVDKDTVIRSATINTTYDWNNMSNTYLTSNAITPANIAVATLMRDAGCGANMEYGIDGSGTTDYDAAISFVNNFSYNPYSLKFLQKELYTDDEWAQMIYNEIKQLRPILYGGSTKTKEGHAFVFDGINTEGNVDVNWGWGGACDGWYDIFDLTPSGLGEEFSSGTTFSEGNDMIIGFDPHPDATGSDFSIWGTDKNCSFSISPDNKLSITMTAFYNFAYKTFTGDFAIICENTSTSVLTPIYNFFQEHSYESLSGFTYGKEVQGNLDISNLSPGTYKVYIASKATNETSWSPVRSFITHDVISYTLTKTNDGALTLTGIDKVKNEKENNDKNIRIYDISGKLLNVTTDGNTISGKGIFIIKQGNETKKVMKP